MKGDARSLDYSSHALMVEVVLVVAMEIVRVVVASP